MYIIHILYIYILNTDISFQLSILIEQNEALDAADYLSLFDFLTRSVSELQKPGFHLRENEKLDMTTIHALRKLLEENSLEALNYQLFPIGYNTSKIAQIALDESRVKVKMIDGGKHNNKHHSFYKSIHNEAVAQYQKFTDKTWTQMPCTPEDQLEFNYIEHTRKQVKKIIEHCRLVMNAIADIASVDGIPEPTDGTAS